MLAVLFLGAGISVVKRPGRGLRHRRYRHDGGDGHSRVCGGMALLEWPLWGAALLMAPFVAIDLVFLAANALKIVEGRLVAPPGGGLLLVIMSHGAARICWPRGTRRHRGAAGRLRTLDEKRGPERVSGTAVFLTSHPETVPTALLHNLGAQQDAARQSIILSVETLDAPRVDPSTALSWPRVSEAALHPVRLRFGYMEDPNIPQALPFCRAFGVKFDVMQTSFFLSRRSLRPSARSEMPAWQDRLFIWLARRASDASLYFRIPTSRAVEVGTQIVI